MLEPFRGLHGVIAVNLNGDEMKVENYNLRFNGHHVRVATKVILDDGTEIKFIDQLSKKKAIENAEYQLMLLEKSKEILNGLS